MRLSYRWLKEFIDIDWDAYELADKLTMAGLEVDSVESIDTSGSVVAEVKEVQKKGHLLLCKADIGSRLVNVATGDSTVKVGEKLPFVAAGGAVGDRLIEKRKFGDFVSEGMFLSAEELGLEESSDELFRLDPNFKSGKPLREVDEFDDYIIELELTPNRADALSVLGVARDVKALSKKEIHLPVYDYKPIDKHVDDFIGVEIHDYENCPRYTLCLADVNVKPSPFFMRMRLLKSGIRAINNIVDITNFVLMSLGQPMHAFDFNKLNGNIVVRRAKEKEKIVALDGKEYPLDETMLVIADSKAPVAIAGVMGGEFSSVDENTKTIALESAFFNPVSVRLTARKLKLHTESSHRFERGVDPNLCLEASKYALSLIERFADGKVYNGFIDNKNKEFVPKSVLVNFSGINDLLGSKFTPDEIAETLVSLNMDIEKVDRDSVKITIPTYRFDIEGEADIAEEVARIKGYNTIESTFPLVETRFKVKDRTEELSNRVAKTLADFGLFETKNYSFVDDRKLVLFDRNRDRFVYLRNPLIDTQNVMRTTLSVSLLDTLVFNILRGARSVPIFEVGRVFLKDGDYSKEFVRVGILLWGLREFSWHDNQSYFDFFDIKGAACAVGGALNAEFEYRPSSKDFLHPKRSADIYLDGELIGYIGELHPDLYEPYDIKFEKKNRILLGEIDLTLAAKIGDRVEMFEQLPKLPTVWRDLAVVVDKNISWGSIEKEVKSFEHVYKVALFDVYDKLEDPNKVSLAFRVVLKRDDRTFTDEEIETIIKAIYNRLSQMFNAKLRGE